MDITRFEEAGISKAGTSRSSAAAVRKLPYQARLASYHELVIDFYSCFPCTSYHHLYVE
jgi:hypothetical protein